MTTNSIKHAFEGRGRGHIEVQIAIKDESEQFDQAEFQQVTLEFRDDGPGWPKEVLGSERENVGLQIVRMTVLSSLGGRLELTNDRGAVATIAFRLLPIAHPVAAKQTLWPRSSGESRFGPGETFGKRSEMQ